MVKMPYFAIKNRILTILSITISITITNFNHEHIRILQLKY